MNRLAENPLPAIAILGPTASGKTQLAIRLAKALKGEVISVDSALVYRGMDIGTAKPTLAERDGIVHHLIDWLEPVETYSTGRFRQDALNLMRDIGERGHVPILAGGTMLYHRGLFHGLAELPAAHPMVRHEIENEARGKGWKALHAELESIDPAAARRIHPNDSQRIQRALEVFRLTGVAMSELTAGSPPPELPCRCFRIVLMPGNRERLNLRIASRFHAMLEQGLVDEVRALRARGDLDPDRPSMRAVGYRQVWGFLDGAYDEGRMTELAITATRQFAKRQLTWLRKEAGATVYDSDRSDLRAKVLEDYLRFTGR